MLYNALEEGVNVNNALGDLNGAKIGDIMDSWISQPGHPIIEVEIDYTNNTVSLSQVIES